MSQLVLDCTKELEIWLQVLSDITHARHIPASVAIIRRTPYCHHILALEVKFVSFVHQLMRSGDEIQAVDVAELLRNSVSEQPACSARRYSPRLDIFGV